MEPIVKISLKEYDELREFKENMLKNMVCVNQCRYDWSIHNEIVDLTFYTHDDLVKKITEKAKEIEKKNNKELRELNILISKLKKMNWWQFKKWKKE